MIYETMTPRLLRVVTVN